MSSSPVKEICQELRKRIKKGLEEESSPEKIISSILDACDMWDPQKYDGPLLLVFENGECIHLKCSDGKFQLNSKSMSKVLENWPHSEIGFIAKPPYIETPSPGFLRQFVVMRLNEYATNRVREWLDHPEVNISVDFPGFN